MSGIYISGISMPKEDSALCIVIHHDGKVCHFFDLQGEQIATAVPVPEHGELVDRQELLKEQLSLMNGSQRIAVVRVMDICSAKVFIPAEEGEG